jgi:DNA-binding winged helix-turn-helix (wHTH) protein
MPNLEAPDPQTSSHNLPTETFKLGNLTVDPQTRRIANKEQSLACELSVFNLLLYFCAHSGKDGESGQIISRDQMIADVWKGRVVSDNAINRKIYQLRKELAILDSENEYIETVTKYGYRLSHNVTAIYSQAAMPGPQLPAPSKTQYQWLFAIIGVVLLLIALSQWNNKPQQRQPPKLKQLTFEYQEQIYTLQLSTGKLEVVLDQSFEAYTISWSSDGKSIYYGSTKSGDWQLWSYNLASKTRKQQTFNGGYSGYDSPKDGLFYYSKYHQNGLWQADANGEEQLIIEDFSLLNWLNWRNS